MLIITSAVNLENMLLLIQRYKFDLFRELMHPFYLDNHLHFYI